MHCSQLWMILFLPSQLSGHLEMSGDLFGCHNLRVETIGIEWVEDRAATKYLAIFTTALTTELPGST